MISKGKLFHFFSEVTGFVQAANSQAKERSNPKVKILTLLRDYYGFTSVADLGCGNAGWLVAARSLGASSVHGYDIPELDIADRMIDPSEFSPCNLGEPAEFEQEFDLAISTEVAEHIPIEQADQFIANLTHAAPVVLFSAATPYQGGLGHTNENWIEYWHNYFDALGFVCFDFVRDKIWHDPGIPFFYRQNIVVYANKEKAENFISRGLSPNPHPKTLIHPDMLIKAVHRAKRINSGKHTIDWDAKSYYGLFGESDGASIENQNFGDKSFLE